MTTIPYKYLAEYIWIGGNGELRSKTKVLELNDDVNTMDPNNLPIWNYDGSSTNQAPSNDSEVYIRPCAVYRDPFRNMGDILVLCDTYLPNGKPHPTNTRYGANQLFNQALELQPWFGIEQEFFMISHKTNLPLGFHQDGSAHPQGQYYCSIGTSNCFGRSLAEKSLRNCLRAGLGVTGLNFEVAPGQCEIQVRGVGIRAADELILLRYILQRTSESFNVSIELHPKPVSGDWNGSGCHTNFSTKPMREDENGYQLIQDAIAKLSTKHMEHIAVYGEGNELRLTGKHETSPITEFSYGTANRGCSIRIPNETITNGRGYFEDRRPSSNMDPYLVCSKLFETCCL